MEVIRYEENMDPKILPWILGFLTRISRCKILALLYRCIQTSTTTIVLDAASFPQILIIYFNWRNS
jgi:hypothetical protein